ncbi:MAG: Xaa-Pro peptidase family protein [Desulforhopalus sp.]
MVAARLQQLKRCLSERGLAAVAVNAGPTLTYLTGLHFHLMERPVVIIFTLSHDPTIILPELEQAKLDHLLFPAQVFAYGENPTQWAGIFHDALATLGLSGEKVGVEPGQLRLLEYDYLRSACGDIDFIDGSEVFAALRAVKDEEEIACMGKAVAIAENALEATLPMVKKGISEKDIAGELFLQLVRHGSDTSLPFSPIVSSGPNGANPHAQPSTRQLAPGDLLVIDWGASFAGYVSDITRTFAVGEIDTEAEKIHRIVQQANAAGRAAGRPGVSCATVDKATREVIEQAGYGRFFPHRTGHGIGMECHEHPYMRGDNEQLLEVGMAYTVEPGIYLPERNGVRIEDDMVVTAEGSESLSTMSREIRIVG